MRYFRPLLGVSALVLALATTQATAAPTTWNFTISNVELLIDGNSMGTDSPLRGRFTGEDLNQDGIVGRGELSFFEIDGFRFLPSTGLFSGCAHNGLECMSWSHLDEFSYSSQWGTFLAEGSASGFRESYDVTIFFAEPGEHMSPLVNYEHREAGHFVQYQATAATTIAVTPVPEPASLALFGGGLAAVGAWVRRRKPQAAGRS